MKIKRLLAVLLSTALVVSMIPSFVFADEANGGPEESEVTETAVDETTKQTENETEPSESEREEETVTSESEPSNEPSAPTEETVPSATEDEERTDPEHDTQEAMNKVIASGTCGDDAKWSIDGNGKLSITGTGDVRDYVSNGPWYSKRTSIKSIYIEDGITGYGFECFKGLTNVTSVSIAGSVKYLEKQSFSDCKKLTSVNLGEGIILVSTAFQECSALKSITLPSTVRSIGQNAFKGCKSLASISIPSTVTAIGKEAFSGCTSLKTVKLPDNINCIYDGLFSGCTGLTSISIPEGVIYIGVDAFRGCTSLASVRLPDTLMQIDNNAFTDCKSLTGISLPDLCANYGKGVFSGCTKLVSISFPSGTESISEQEFANCTSLKTISIPKSVKTIFDGGFEGCTSLTDIYYNGNDSDWSAVKILDSNSDILKNVNINYSGTFHSITVKSAEHGYITLSKYSATENEIIKVTVHADPGYYLYRAYVNGRGYETEFLMPGEDATVTPKFLEIVHAPVGAHYYNGIYTYRIVNNAINGTGTVAFSSLRMVSNSDENYLFSIYSNISIPATVTLNGVFYKVMSIDANATKDFKYIRTLSIGSNIAKIGDNAFYGCQNLTKVSGCAGVKTIGKNAFAKCPLLSSFTITSKKLAKIGTTCFTGDSKLKTLYIKNTTKLTKKGVKKSLKGSSIKTVKVKKSKVKKYKKFFTKKNCGRKVKVKK